MSFDQWSKVNLVDCLDKLIDYRGKTPAKSEKGILTLSAKSVKNSNVNYSEAYTISEDEYKKFMVRGIPVKGDILITTEAPMGQVAKLDRNGVAVAQRLLTLRPNPKILDNDYLLYYLQSPIGQAELKARESGSTVTGIKQAEFRKINIILPPLSEQKAIANILSSLDNKIELNNKINKNLEELAQTLYKHWFVDFEFPNEERLPYKSSGGKMVESELGLIPKGWKISKLGDIVVIKYGKNFPTKQLLSKGYPVFGGNGIIGYSNNFLYKEPQVIVSCRGAASGKVNITKKNSFVTNNSLILEFNETISFEYLKERSLHSKYYQYVTGSAQPQITINSIKEDLINIPSKNIQQKFSSIMKSINELFHSNKEQNKKLEQLRDILLPKLMNGEIRVPIKE